MNNLVENKLGHNGIIKYPKLHKLQHQIKRLFRSKYIGGSSIPYDWTNPVPVPTLMVKNQFTASSCGGEATSYGSEVLTGAPASAKSVYSRGFASGGGMTVSSLETVAQQDINLELDVPSYTPQGDTNESFMEDISWYTPLMMSKGQINALGTPVTVPLDVESIAQAIRDYKFVIFLIQGQNGNNWLGYVPTPPSSSNPNPIWGHFLCGVSPTVYNEVKGVVVYNSWGIEAGNGGKQFITQDYIDSGSIVDCIAFNPSSKIINLEAQVTILQKLVALWQQLRGIKSN